MANENEIRRHFEHSDYGATKDGRTFSFKSGKARQLKHTYVENRDYYKFGVILPSGSITSVSVQVFVYECWIGKVPENHWVRHKDGDPSNNHVDNLKLVPAIPGSPLKWEEAAEIKRLVSVKGLRRQLVADLFQVDQSTVNKIVNNQTWDVLVYDSRRQIWRFPAHDLDMAPLPGHVSLIGAIIEQAREDFLSHDAELKREAAAYFDGPVYRKHLDMVDMDKRLLPRGITREAVKNAL